MLANTLTDQEKLIRRNLVLHDANFLSQYLDVCPSFADEVCESYRRIAQNFKELFDTINDDPQMTRLILDFERAEVHLITVCIAEKQKHD